MNYQKIYDQLIEKRRLYPWNKTDGYCEYHHIIPLCIGGNNDIKSKSHNVVGSNIIGLTAKEHFIAHLLLWKIYKETQYENKMTYCIMRMMCQTKNQKRVIKNSRIYDIVRKRYGKFSSKNQSKYITYNNETHSIREWAKIFGLTFSCFYNRLRSGMTMEQIKNTPNNNYIHKVQLNGKLYTLKELSVLYEISVGKLRQRIFRFKIPPEIAINNQMTKEHQRNKLKQQFANEYNYNGETNTIDYFGKKFNIRPATIRDRMKRWNCDIKTALEAPLKNSEGYSQFLINVKKKFSKK